MKRKIIQTFLKDQKLDAVYISTPANLRFFSNFVGTSGSLFLSKKRGFLFTDARYFLVAKTALPAWISIVDITKGFEKPWKKVLRKNRVKRLGIESAFVSHRSFLRLHRFSSNVRLTDISEGLDELRMQKTNEEIRKLVGAQTITDRIFDLLRRGLKKGLSEKEIAWKIETLAHELGADDISFPPIIGINEHSASPHHKNTDRKLKKGDLVLLDFGVIYNGYCSDMTRVLFTRPLRGVEQKIYSLVREAQETAERRLRSGFKGYEIDAIAREIITKKGYGKYFGHSLGHGVGLEIHELPNLSEKYKKPIKEGSVVTVEPGIYLPGKFGIRLEDMGLVMKDRFRVFTKSPKDLQEIRVRL